jgi:hypothetical protein
VVGSRVTVSAAKNYIEVQMVLGLNEAAFASAGLQADVAVVVELVKA